VLSLISLLASNQAYSAIGIVHLLSQSVSVAPVTDETSVLTTSASPMLPLVSIMICLWMIIPFMRGVGYYFSSVTKVSMAVLMMALSVAYRWSYYDT